MRAPLRSPRPREVEAAGGVTKNIGEGVHMVLTCAEAVVIHLEQKDAEIKVKRRSRIDTATRK